MPTSEFAPETGHESDRRATSPRTGIYLPRRRQPSYYEQIVSLETEALQMDPEDYRRDLKIAEAMGWRKTLASFNAEVPPVVDFGPEVFDMAGEPDRQPEPSPEELAHLGCAGVPVEEAEYAAREVEDDDGAYYGKTAEEEFHHD